MGSLYPNTFLNSCYSSNAPHFSATAPDDSNRANQPGTYHNCGPWPGLHISPCPIWCAKFSSYRKLLALLRYASSFHFIKIRTRTHAHTHTTGISFSEYEIFYWTFPASTNIPLRTTYNYSKALILQSHKLLRSL